MKKGGAYPVASKSEQDWRCEEDHRTLERAEEVRSDPARMRGVARHHRKKMQEMKRVGTMLANPRRKIPKRPSMARSAR